MWVFGSGHKRESGPRKPAGGGAGIHRQQAPKTGWCIESCGLWMTSWIFGIKCQGAAIHATSLFPQLKVLPLIMLCNFWIWGVSRSAVETLQNLVCTAMILLFSEIWWSCSWSISMLRKTSSQRKKSTLRTYLKQSRSTSSTNFKSK